MVNQPLKLSLGYRQFCHCYSNLEYQLVHVTYIVTELSILSFVRVTDLSILSFVRI